MKIKKIIALGMIMVMMLSVFTACGKEEEKTADGYAKEIYLYNWSEYMTQDVLDKFKDEYGITVVQSTYESNDELLAKLVAGNKGEYDIAVPTNYYIKALLENDLLETYDDGALSNLDNIDSAYLGMDFDSDNSYSVPYMGTLDVWIGNKKLLDELGIEVNSYEDIASDKLAGNIIMTDDAQQDIEIGLEACDLDPTSMDADDIAKARDYLISMNDNVKSYSTTVDVRDAMAKGEAALACMYSGEALQALEANPDLEVVMGEEKMALSLDNFVLLKGSSHKKEAQMFIDFCLRPDISAELTNEYKFVCFNKAAVDKMDKKLAENPVCVLTDDMKARTYSIDEINGDALAAEVDAMTQVKTSR